MKALGFALICCAADKRKSNPRSWDKVRDHFRAEKDHALEVLHSSFTDRAVVKPREMEVNVEDINKILRLLNGYNIWPARLIRSAYYQDGRFVIILTWRSATMVISQSSGL